MQHVISKDEIAHGITNPDVFQQLDIITDTWDGIKKSRELETISEADRRLLLHRLMNYRSDPGSATDWADLKQVVYDRYAEKG